MSDGFSRYPFDYYDQGCKQDECLRSSLIFVFMFKGQIRIKSLNEPHMSDPLFERMIRKFFSAFVFCVGVYPYFEILNEDII